MSVRFSACLHMDQVRWRKQPPTGFPKDTSHVTLGQIKRPCPWHWRESGRQGLYACEAWANLAVSEQITGRFQIIVRPVPALVIRHAVLSDARAAGEVKRHWHKVFCWGPTPSLRIWADQLWHRFCLGNAQHLHVWRYIVICLVNVKHQLCNWSSTRLLSQNSMQIQGVICSVCDTAHDGDGSLQILLILSLSQTCASR